MCEVEVVVDHPDLLRKARDRGCWPDLFKNAYQQWYIFLQHIYHDNSINSFRQLVPSSDD
jgi:hypothetical protein